MDDLRSYFSSFSLLSACGVCACVAFTTHSADLSRFALSAVSRRSFHTARLKRVAVAGPDPHGHFEVERVVCVCCYLAFIDTDKRVPDSQSWVGGRHRTD